MKKQSKLKEIILQAIKRHVGENASKKEISDYLQGLDMEGYLELVSDVDNKLTGGNGKAIVEDAVDYSSHKLGEETDGECDEWSGEEDNEDCDDDGFYIGGRLECMPALKVKKYTLRIKLRGITPGIWRKIEVPSSVKLTSLAEIIITAMGWHNSHLHQFVTKGRAEYYATAKKDDDEDDFWGMHRLWGGDYTIAHLLKAEKEKVTFEYDFGDGWEHDVVLSKVEDYADGEPLVVRLIGGKRACPPEDCGGVWGYNDLCEVMQHPYSKRAKEMKQWLGYRFDPEEFWLDDAQDDIDAFNF